MKPTKETYDELDRAYGHFNKALFGDALPSCIITMQRHKQAYGYFWGGTWSDARGTAIADEIALNPDHFRTRSAEAVLSTLVHEMCHLQQHHFGKPSRAGYHNREWGGMMKAVGLIPSATGEPGGPQTGQQMTHFIEKGGAFEKACATLLAAGFSIPWQALTGGDEATRKKKAASKTKYSCPCCGLNAWAKPDVRLVCGECEEELAAAD
ncbi:MAG: SprT-like domain-containing protein [Saprospiraceae bacterium]|nr:SprT-like domain-containing protein [Saprospiraceae bacterium]